MNEMENVYEFGPFRLETKERRLLRDGHPVQLRGKVLDTLCVLVSQSGRLIDKDDLIAAVWPDTVVEENNLAHNINALRKALGDAALIETVPGRGYRFLGTGLLRVVAPTRRSGEIAADGPVLIERDQQMTSLQEAFAAALEGNRQFVCIPGEPGVGKTTLVHAFLQEVRRTSAARIGRGQCLENRGEMEPYIAVLEALGRLCREPDGDEVASLLYRRAPTWLAQMPWLASAPALAQLPQRNLGVTRDRMLREFAELVEELASSRPFVLCLDDLHWCDDSTLSLLELLARRDDPAQLMLIGTYRPAEATRATQALEALVQGMRIRGQCRVVRPTLLSADAVQSIIDRAVPGIALNPALVHTLHQRTGGNPLFVLALVDHWKTTAAVVLQTDGWRAVADFDELGKGVPESLTAMIHQNMDALSPEEQLLLEAASVAGREFVASILASGLGSTEDEAELRCAILARQGTFIRDAGVLEWPGGGLSARFRFIHALYREAVYQRVPAGRRSRLHRLIGEELERAYGGLADANANELARHFRYGGDQRRSIRYFRLAAEQALRRSAHREAVSLLQCGLELVEQQPETTERHADEFAFRSMMAPATLAVKGFAAPEAAFNFQRARELGLRLVRVEEMYQLLFHLAGMHELRGEYRLAEQILDERLRLPGVKDGAAVQIDSNTLLACSLFHQGEFSRSIERAEDGVNLYDPQQYVGLIAAYGENPAVACHGWAALSLWCLGYADKALERVQRSLEFASHPDLMFSQASAKVRAAHVYQLRRDPEQTLHWATAAATLAEEHGYLYANFFALALKGWALSMNGQPADGLILMREGMALLDRIGANMDRPYLLALSSEIAAANGQPSEALAQVTEALSLVRESRAYFYEAELYRLRGVLLLQTGGRAAEDEAEANIRQALEIAQKQKARALELRAAVSLCRLLQARGMPQEGLRVLAPAYRWFDEGVGTADLIEAGELLASSVHTSQSGKRADARR
jgi:DNA-binding winged helix-turn-helix (wHTH) protein/tetratricopeptide (TPR) repeat protein